MSAISELTEKQFKSLLDEYFAPPEKRSKMTESEIRDLSKRLNKKFDIPFVSETKEEKILIKIIIKIDTFLYDNLPNEFYDLIRSSDEGISDNEAKRLIKRLSKLANKKIDIPYIPELMEGLIFRFIIGIIINAARKTWNLDEAKKRADEMIIPDKKNVKDNELDGMIL